MFFHIILSKLSDFFTLFFQRLFTQNVVLCKQQKITSGDRCSYWSVHRKESKKTSWLHKRLWHFSTFSIHRWKLNMWYPWTVVISVFRYATIVSILSQISLFTMFMISGNTLEIYLCIGWNLWVCHPDFDGFMSKGYLKLLQHQYTEVICLAYKRKDTKITSTCSECVVEVPKNSWYSRKATTIHVVLASPRQQSPYLYTFIFYTTQIREILSFDPSIFFSGAVMWLTP